MWLRPASQADWVVVDLGADAKAEILPWARELLAILAQAAENSALQLEVVRPWAQERLPYLEQPGVW